MKFITARHHISQHNPAVIVLHRDGCRVLLDSPRTVQTATGKDVIEQTYWRITPVAAARMLARTYVGAEQEFCSCLSDEVEKVANGDTVDYHGSLKDAHGRYTVAAVCDCELCDFRTDRLELRAYDESGRFTGGLLEHVRPESVTVVAQRLRQGR